MSEVLDANSREIRALLLDFRCTKDGEKKIARLRGEGRFLSPLQPENAAARVLVEYEPYDAWKGNRPSFLRRWLTAMRLPYLMFSLFPLLFAFSVYHTPKLAGALRERKFLLSLILFAGTALIHVGCHFWSDAEDYLRGVDSPESTGGSGVIQRLWIPARHLRYAAAVFFLLGFLLLAGMLFALPWGKILYPLSALGLFGALAAASYTGWPFHYKYLGLGEPILFLLAGPILAMGASLAYFADSSYMAWFALASLPFSFLAILRLHLGNLQRIPFDRMAGARTIASLVSFRTGKALVLFLLLAPALCLPVLYAIGIVRLPSLLPLISLGFLVAVLPPLLAAKGPLDPELKIVRKQIPWMQLMFGLLYCYSVWIS